MPSRATAVRKWRFPKQRQWQNVLFSPHTHDAWEYAVWRTWQSFISSWIGGIIPAALSLSIGSRQIMRRGGLREVHRGRFSSFPVLAAAGWLMDNSEMPMVVLRCVMWLMVLSCVLECLGLILCERATSASIKLIGSRPSASVLELDTSWELRTDGRWWLEDNL